MAWTRCPHFVYARGRLSVILRDNGAASPRTLTDPQGLSPQVRGLSTAAESRPARLRDEEAAGSNPVTPTRGTKALTCINAEVRAFLLARRAMRVP